MSTKGFTVPVTRKYSKIPITQTQKMLAKDRLKLRQDWMQSVGSKELFHTEASSSFSIALENSFNLFYAGPVYFGEPNQFGSQYIYDSGSGFLTTTTTTCATCNPAVYNPALSTTFVNGTDSTYSQYSSTVNLQYGSADLFGYMGTDMVSVAPFDSSSSSNVVDNFSFFLI